MSAWTIRQAVISGRLVSYRAFGRVLHFRRADLDALMEAGRDPFFDLAREARAR